MRHFFLTSGLVCSTLLLTGAVDHQGLFSDTPKEDVFLPRSAETVSGQLLDQVLEALGSDRVRWLRMSVRQKMYGDHPFETEGRYLLGPEQRLRLELKIKAGAQVGRVLVVSDGHNLWQGRWLAGIPGTPTIEALPKAGPNQGPGRDFFLQARGFGGLLPLMRQIRPCLKDTRQQTGLYRDRSAIQITASWNAPEEVLKTLPHGQRARRCNIVIDAATLWPCRIEWLGSPRPDNYPILLMKMDFLDPIVNQPMSPVEWTRAFRFTD